MSVLFAVSLFFLIIYTVLIILYAAGWWRIKMTKPPKAVPATFASVIIPVRNEEHNISRLLHLLEKQDVPSSAYQIIVVDDHSEDNTREKAEKKANLFPNLLLISLPNGQAGKKAALNMGFQKAKGEIIITADADITVEKEWLKTILHVFNAEKTDMLIGPVIMEYTNFFGQLQALDFFSLTASGAGAAGTGIPVMCSGANLAFRKSALSEIITDDTRYASGDDVFLLHAFKKAGKQIRFLKSTAATACTPQESSPKAFFRQRVRWVSKSKAYTDFDTVFAALTVGLANLSLLCMFAVSLFNPAHWKDFLLLFFLKFSVDLLLLAPSLWYMKRQKLLFVYPVLQSFYFIYVFFTGLAGLIMPFTWKQRKFKK